LSKMLTLRSLTKGGIARLRIPPRLGEIQPSEHLSEWRDGALCKGPKAPYGLCPSPADFGVGTADQHADAFGGGGFVGAAE
jgi:hypothetical protein